MSSDSFLISQQSNQVAPLRLSLKTAAEKYLEASSSLAVGAGGGSSSNNDNKPSSFPEQQQLDLFPLQPGEGLPIIDNEDPSYGDILKLNLDEVSVLYNNKGKTDDWDRERRRGKRECPAWLTSCAKCTRSPHGILKGDKKTLKKQHIVQYFEKTVHSRIDKNKLAIIMDGASDLTITYKELDEISNSIAYNLNSFLQQSPFKNNNPEGHLIIAVFLPICYEYVILLLGILKLGAAILPISTELPKERIIEIIKLTQPILVITGMETEEMSVFEEQSQQQQEFQFQMLKLKVEELWDRIYSSNFTDSIQPFKFPIDNPHYPIMRKRAVAISVLPSDTQDLQMVAYDSRVFLNRISWEDHVFMYVKHEYSLLPPNFDTIDSLGDVLVQLCVGSTVVGLRSPIEYRIPDMLFMYCEKYKLRRLVLWPTLLKACTISLRLFEDFLPMVSTVRYWICIGGCIRSELASMFFELPLHPSAHLIHMYHFEDCAGALSFQIYENLGSLTNQSFYARLPVGTPVSNTDVYILDGNMNLVKDGESGEIYVSTVQSPRVFNLSNPPNSYYVANPFSKRKDRQLLIKTLDYGKIMTRSNGSRVLFHEVSRDKHYFVDNQLVWLLHLDMYLGRLTTLVQQFHTLCYRPNEDDQTLLAFCVMLNKKVTEEEVEDQLKLCLPPCMVPEVVRVQEIPTLPGSPHIDDNALLKIYIGLRAKRQQFDSWSSLNITDKSVLRAAKVLAYVIYAVLGVPIKEIVGTYWTQPYLNLKRASVTRATFIVKELHSNRYPLYTDEFVCSESLKDIAVIMVEARRTRGFCNKNCPPEEVFFIKNRYKLEIVMNGSRYTVSGLLGKCFTQRGQLDYYAEVESRTLRKYFDSVWPVFVEKKLSILIRKKRDNRRNQLVGAVLNMNWHDEIQLTKRPVTKNIGYKLELIKYLESSLTDSHFPQDKTHVLQICYIGLNSDVLTRFEIHGLTDKIIRSMLIIGKVKGFEALVLITYDYFTTDICVNNYGFNIVKQCQVNTFIASDGSRPYEQCPDTMYAVLCWKLLSKIEKAETGKRLAQVQAKPPTLSAARAPQHNTTTTATTTTTKR